MRLVIYDDDSLEPITVVNVPGLTERDIERLGGRLRMAVPPRMVPTVEDPKNLTSLKMDIVDLWFERFCRGRHGSRPQETWMCFTKQADLAMLLRPDWLPGQRATINDLERYNDRLAKLIGMAIFRAP